MNITTEHARHLGGALSDLLGCDPAPGDIAFLRCIASGLVDELLDQQVFETPGFEIHGVVDRIAPRRITADRAVEVREDKGQPVVLLIDTARAGAGLDGIYSSAREIGETELFEKAGLRARRAIRGFTRYADLAIKAARRIGQRNRLSPAQEFDFLVAVSQTEYGPGGALPRLGLWPVLVDGAPEARDLELSVDLVNRLLAVRDDARTPEGQVAALLLDDASGEVGPKLERFLREAAHRSPLETVAALQQEKDLWIGPLRPRFAVDAVRAIELVPWTVKGKLVKWSGLRVGEDDDKPVLRLDPSSTRKDAGRLEVRWTTQPDTLGKNSVNYRVVIMAADEELAEQFVAHKENHHKILYFRSRISPD